MKGTFKSDNVGLKEVTTKELTEENFTAIVNATIRTYSAPRSEIKRYMSLSTGIRIKYLFIILMAVKALEQPTKANVSGRLELNGAACAKAIDYLFEVGYISKVGKPRLIIPFQRTKIDVGYVITEKGEGVLRKLLIYTM